MNPWRRAGITASVGLVIVFIVLAFVGGQSDSSPAGGATGARFVQVGDLATLEGSLGHPLYWAGDPGDDRIELRQEAGGSVYLRYLPPGAKPGERPAAYLTVGTYPVGDATEALRRTAESAGARVRQIGDGGVVLANPSSTGSVYLAYPGSDLEIEVYDPEPGRAMELVRSGAIEPVEG